jgi:hypothetical protein
LIQHNSGCRRHKVKALLWSGSWIFCEGKSALPSQTRK